jgi:CheY-like chemotaxis protein
MKTILVADDFEDSRSMLRLWLERRGYRVLEAEDGAAACDAALAHRPDLILVDIAMPVRSGLSAAHRIRKDPNTAGIPVVAVTAYSSADFREDAERAGCAGFLTKPIDLDQMDALLKRLL